MKYPVKRQTIYSNHKWNILWSDKPHNHKWNIQWSNKPYKWHILLYKATNNINKWHILSGDEPYKWHISYKVTNHISDISYKQYKVTNPINDIQTLLATTLKMVNVNKGLWSFLRCDKLKKRFVAVVDFWFVKLI